MARTSNGNVELEYDVRGPEDGDVILLIMGIGAQLTAWRNGFCDRFVDAGYRVVRFDNRDAGLSTRSEGPEPKIADLASVIASARRRSEAPYTFSDMAADAISVLDAVGAQRAHVVGASLGGMIAQTVAIDHPSRVRSLTSIMSTTGGRRVGLPNPGILRASLAPRPTQRAAAIEHDVDGAQRIAGPHFDRDEMRAYVTEAHDRCDQPGGVLFQARAMLASGDRTPALRRIDVPTLVIHGRPDPLVRLSGGEATAKAVPRSRFIVHGDMAHDLPKALWPTLTGSIIEHARTATERDERLTAAAPSR